MSLPGETKLQVEKLLRAGDRQGAVQFLNNTFNVSLEEANILVEALEKEMDIKEAIEPVFASSASATTDGQVGSVVTQLLQQGRRVEAVRYVRKMLKVGLREAVVMVEGVAKETDPNYASLNLTGFAGCLRMVAKGLGIFLLMVSLMFLGAAAVIYYFQSQSISKSDRIMGKVSEMKFTDSGAGAPLIGYEWKGKQHAYQSNTYASPPNYDVGETVFLYVNRGDADDVIIDTFSDRYALIVGLGGIGAILCLISIVFLYFGRRKF